MAQITPFSARVKASLRDSLLDAAANLLAERGFHRVRMADVAAAAGVSRQTVYNEFGGKEQLAQAVTMRITAEFLQDTATRLASADTLLDGVRDSVRATIEQAGQNRLLASVLTGTDAEDLLPFLTTRGRPVLDAATELVRNHVQHRLPDLPPQVARLYAETTVRLSLSHLLLPTGTAEQAAAAVAEIAGAVLHQHL